MKKLTLLLAMIGVFGLIPPAAALESLIVWNKSIGVERAGGGATVSPLFAAGDGDGALTISLVAGEGDHDNARFTVEGAELRTADALAEGDYTIRLRAEIVDGDPIEDAFTISVVPAKVAPKIAAGDEHTAFLRSDGQVFTFGRGNIGQLGHADDSDRIVPTPLEHENLEGHVITDVATGNQHTVLLSADGTVFTYGSWLGGGYGDNEFRFVPTPMEHENLQGHWIVAIAAGGSHTLLLSADGTVFSFGWNVAGELGHGDTGTRLVPEAIEHENIAAHTITRIAAGDRHSVLISSDGTAFTFGSGRSGRLGHGDANDRLVPTPIEHESLFDHTIILAAAGEAHTVLLSVEGTVFTFGAGGAGRLGHGDGSIRSIPTPIEHENLMGRAITGIAAGSNYTVLVSSDGTVFTFGWGGYGQLGHGDTSQRTVPTPIEDEGLTGRRIVRAAAGTDHTLVIAEDGTVLSFGAGARGELGQNDHDWRTVPTPVEFFRQPGHRLLRVTGAGDGVGSVFVNGQEVSGLHYFVEAEEGTEFLIEAVPEEGSFFEGWRRDLSGVDLTQNVVLDVDMKVSAVFRIPSVLVWSREIGTERTGPGASISTLYAPHAQGDSVTFALVPGEGDTDNARFAIVNDELQTTEALPEGEYSIRLRATHGSGISVEGAYKVLVTPGVTTPKLAAGGDHTVLLSSDGTVFTFGRGGNGRLGHGDMTDRLEPTPIEHENISGHTITGVAAGREHTVLVSADGTVFTFGRGIRAQLGQGDTFDRLVPTPLDSEVLEDHTIVRIAAGDEHTALLSSDGTVFTFGYGAFGRLGHETTASRLVPRAIQDESLFGHTIAEVAGGGEHSVLLSSDGTVFTFGSGWQGRLGHGDTQNRIVPWPIMYPEFSDHKITRISAGGAHTGIVSDDATVFTNGAGEYGRLGHGEEDSGDKFVPTLIEHENLAAHKIVDIAASASHTILLSSEGSVFSFGYGWGGWLGHGDTSHRFVPTLIEHEELRGHTFSAIAAGAAHNVLLSSNGAVFTFGVGESGRLGHGDTERRLVPAEIEEFNLIGGLSELDRFQLAMGDAGLSGDDAAPEAEPFREGVSNLLKYAFNMDLSGPDRRMLTAGAGEAAGLPAVTREESGSGPALRIEFVRRRNGHLIYTPKISTDLINWDTVIVEPTVSEIDADWERVVVEIPLAPLTPLAFGAVGVAIP